MAKSIFFKIITIALSATSIVCVGGNMDTQYNKTSYLMSGGSNSYGSETIGSVHANGMVKLDGTRVQGCAEINGQLYADNANIGSLLINGKASLNNCHVKGTTIINGFLVSDNTSFQGELSVASEITILSCSTAASILIRKTQGNANKQVLDLRDSTMIYGDIVFESGHGQVIIDADCEITGFVHGGTIRQR